MSTGKEDVRIPKWNTTAVFTRVCDLSSKSSYGRVRRLNGITSESIPLL